MIRLDNNLGVVLGQRHHSLEPVAVFALDGPLRQLGPLFCVGDSGGLGVEHADGVNRPSIDSAAIVYFPAPPVPNKPLPPNVAITEVLAVPLDEQFRVGKIGEAEAVRQISLSHVLSQLANFGLGFRRDAPAPVEVAQGGQDLVRAAAQPGAVGPRRTTAPGGVALFRLFERRVRLPFRLASR